MAEGFGVGSRVLIAGRGTGMIELDNENGTWNVRFDDDTEADIDTSLLQHEPDYVLMIEQGGGPKVVPAPYDQEKPPGWTRFVCFSDTHGLHNHIPAANYVKADILLHGGDFTNTGEVNQVASFAQWLKDYPASHKVVIAGNHDITFEPDYYKRSWARFHDPKLDDVQARKNLLESGSCVYLEDELVEVMGYSIYGSPWQPEFCEWAFNVPRGEESQKIWAKIPSSVDILMTHGPPAGCGDTTSKRTAVGCVDLRRAIEERAVSVSLSGHIHEGYGVGTIGKTLCINASTCTHGYVPKNPPIVFDLPPPKDLRQFASTMMSDVVA